MRSGSSATATRQPGGPVDGGAREIIAGDHERVLASAAIWVDQVHERRQFAITANAPRIPVRADKLDAVKPPVDVLERHGHIVVRGQLEAEAAHVVLLQPCCVARRGPRRALQFQPRHLHPVADQRREPGAQDGGLHGLLPGLQNLCLDAGRRGPFRETAITHGHHVASPVPGPQGPHRGLHVSIRGQQRHRRARGLPDRGGGGGTIGQNHRRGVLSLGGGEPPVRINDMKQAGFAHIADRHRLAVRPQRLQAPDMAVLVPERHQEITAAVLLQSQAPRRAGLEPGGSSRRPATRPSPSSA